jgi:hypothetical protein
VFSNPESRCVSLIAKNSIGDLVRKMVNMHTQRHSETSKGGQIARTAQLSMTAPSSPCGRPAAFSCAYWVTLTVPAVMVHTVCALGPRPLEQHRVVVV